MVPPALTIDDLLPVLQTALTGSGADRAAARKRAPEIVNQPGAARLLIEVLKTGDPLQTQQAAYGLGHARSDLVRRQLRMLARELTGDRRLSCLAALTGDELNQHLQEQGEAIRAQLIGSSSILALNRPTDFVDLVCEGSSIVELSAVEEIESMRLRYGIGAATMYEPLLQRPLSPPALARAATVLGTEPGADVRRLLRKALSRTRDEAASKLLRREQLRQASRAIAAPQESAREGVAFLRPIKTGSTGSLEIFERVSSGELVRSTVVWPLRGEPEFMSMPVEGALDAQVAHELDPARDARMTLGQARTFLESFRDAHQLSIAPVLARLSDVPAQHVPIPAPGNCLAPEEAQALVSEPLWREWRPFEAVARTKVLDEAELAVAQFERRAGAAWLAEGLRHMAFVMHLRDDARASAVVAEAIWTARKRVSPLVRALARMELERAVSQ